MAETNTQLALPETFKPEVFKSLIDKAPQVYIENKTSVERAVAKGNELLGIIAAKGMSDELDAELNKYQVRVKDTIKLMDDKRKPITNMFRAVATLYTTLEATLDPTKSESIYFKIQKYRNDFVTKKAQEAARLEAERQKKIAKDKEKIEIQTQIETQLRLYFNNHLASIKQTINSSFETMTLETAQKVKQELEAYQPAYLFNHFELFQPNIITTLDPAEQERTLTNAKSGKFDVFANEYKTQLTELKDELLLKLPSKYRELEQIKNASAIEAEMLANQAAERQRLEKEKLEKEANEANEKAIKDAEINKTISTANTLFSSQGASIPVQTARVNEGYEIEIIHAMGYQEIVAFYFQKEGLKSTDFKALEKVTIGAMKKFAETWAKKNDEKIQSIYLKYKEVFKAVATKK